jgi:UDPglucose 6-dehydrogenase
LIDFLLSSYLIKLNFRESAAIYLSKYLLDEGANLVIYDPQVEDSQIIFELSNPQLNLTIESVKQKVTMVHNPYEACNNSHAIVICTEWDEFKVTIIPKILFFNLIASL